MSSRKRAAREVWHLFPDGKVEYGTGEPGYRWAPAYAQVVSANGRSIPLRRLDWYAAAREAGARCVFYSDRSDAVQAWALANREGGDVAD